MEVRNLNDINYADYNPRILSEHDGKSLDASMTTFGDIAGITFNVQTNTLVTGHQRLRLLRQRFGDRVQVQREQVNDAPDDFGTVATGHVVVTGTSLTLAYREVSWNPNIERAANIAANRIEAEWDKDSLAKLNYELSQLENGAELLALTGQTDKEIKKLMDSVSGDDDDENDNKDDSDKLEFRLTREQREVVEDAINLIIATHEMATEESGSKNGSALYYMAREYVDRQRLDSTAQPLPEEEYKTA